MEAFLGTISQHAMNYAIRSGIGLTASYTISQASRLLKTIEDEDDRKEFKRLRGLLEIKSKIVSPAIDLIELISARGNTVLETAVTLTKELRWNLQSLGVRIQKTAAKEELSRKGANRVKSRASHTTEIRELIQEIRKVITQIDENVPLISLAITTSGVSLSTTLPPTVSPSRLLQASTFLSEGDRRYFLTQGSPAQIGPAFTLTLYMLFAGHSYRAHDQNTNIRDSTWKEVIHKARVKLVRSSGILPSSSESRREGQSNLPASSIENDNREIPVMHGEGFQNNYFYHLEIIEDFDDDRVHSFEDDEPRPEQYGGVELAGIREKIPVYQVSRIFYADTGKVLNIGSEEETNNPVLLLKRDINALPPRTMMREDERRAECDDHLQDQMPPSEEEYDSQEDIDEQIRRESSVHLSEEVPSSEPIFAQHAWQLPADLDPEWMALEIYTEAVDSSSEDGHDTNGDSFNSPTHPISDEDGNEGSLTECISRLHLNENSSPAPATPHQTQIPKSFSGYSPQNQNQNFSALPPITSNLSLLEMLLKLTTCQQFVQQSHLTITDELLTFFLEENASTGAGGDNSERQRARQTAKSKIGFDPYNESPIKRRGAPVEEQDEIRSPGEIRQEEILYSEHGYDEHYSREYDQNRRYGFPRGTTPYSEYSNPRVPSPSLQGTPEWLRRSRDSSSRDMPDLPSSPTSPYRPQRKIIGPLDRLQRARGNDGAKGSPLGRGTSVDTDSSLGTSPGSPTLVARAEKVVDG